MKTATQETETVPQAVHRADYRPAPFRIESVELEFDLAAERTLVRSRLELRRDPAAAEPGAPLRLDGEALETLAVRLDGRDLGPDEYALTGRHLELPDPPESFVLETEVAIAPETNRELSGLYASGGNLCTQCEAQGFRRITWFLDRPDVMARYRVTLTADRERYPVLLSNGNRVSTEVLAGGRHRVVWEDPFPKPSYLFALVGGTLSCRAGTFRTRSGRDVRLEVWVEPRDADKCDHALAAMQKAMRWDEETFGLEYDLDLYMIVAVSDFNMGAMENKGLNVFNSRFVLAQPETATDADFESIEGVIAHEYFHNWTGNRVTCRDWFQLTLKEGLTVFRDQQFTADTTSPGVKRIHDVRVLWSHQFPEDAGPMAHPVRPESYIAMDNFYTATVYQKGAEVVRLYHTLLGAEGFRRGLDLYFERHDGRAVTCDDFRAAMADANGRDLEQLARWYSQAGTPRLEVCARRDGGDLVLDVRQLPPRGRDEAEALHVPLRAALLDASGRPLPLDGPGGHERERVLELREREESFRFPGVPEGAVPSLLRGYSAPVELEIERAPGELVFLYRHDDDDFSRWDAGQRLLGERILERAAARSAGPVPDGALPAEAIEAFAAVLADERLDGSMRALLLALPGELALARQMDVVDPDALHAARADVRRALADALADELSAAYARTAPSGPYVLAPEEVHRRALNGLLLAYLSLGAAAPDEGAERAWEHFERADNMTDSETAFACLCELDSPRRLEAIERFHERWKDEPLVLDKWFTRQAVSALPGAPARVRALAAHPDFDVENPNRARSVVGAFAAANPVGFHDPSGEGYAFTADKVLEIGAFNPQVASRLAKSFHPWRRYDPDRQARMRAQLERIAAADGLSPDVYEVVRAALG